MLELRTLEQVFCKSSMVFLKIEVVQVFGLIEVSSEIRSLWISPIYVVIQISDVVFEYLKESLSHMKHKVFCFYLGLSIGFVVIVDSLIFQQLNTDKINLGKGLTFRILIYICSLGIQGNSFLFF